MTYPYEYSEAEKRLISSLKFEHIAANPSTPPPPPLVYMWMGLQCFRENRNDDVAISVRNCLLALDNVQIKGYPKRLTEEFDKLIII